jgi:hypothetical protein
MRGGRRPSQKISFRAIFSPERHQKNRNTQIQRSCVSPFLEIISRSVCSLFFRSSIIKSQFTIIPLLCPSTTKASTQNLQTHPPLPRAFLVRHSSLNYREFKTDNWRVISRHFHSSHLKPIQTTSVIRTRTLSNLFAKKNSDSFLQA